jgi:hypothetical protein
MSCQNDVRRRKKKNLLWEDKKGGPRKGKSCPLYATKRHVRHKATAVNSFSSIGWRRFISRAFEVEGMSE